MIGVFQTTRYYFMLDATQTPLEILDRRDFDDEDLGARLLRTGQVPNLGSAPLGSWFVARLAALTGGKLGFFVGEDQIVDGGSCCLEIMIFTNDQKPVGAMQIQVDDDIIVFGWCAASVDPETVMGEFVNAFVESPSEVREIDLRVRDPENGSRRVLGYNGAKYLGRVKPPPTQKE